MIHLRFVWSLSMTNGSGIPVRWLIQCCFFQLTKWFEELRTELQNAECADSVEGAEEQIAQFNQQKEATVEASISTLSEGQNLIDQIKWVSYRRSPTVGDLSCPGVLQTKHTLLEQGLFMLITGNQWSIDCFHIYGELLVIDGCNSSHRVVYHDENMMDAFSCENGPQPIDLPTMLCIGCSLLLRYDYVIIFLTIPSCWCSYDELTPWWILLRTRVGIFLCSSPIDLLLLYPHEWP